MNIIMCRAKRVSLPLRSRGRWGSRCYAFVSTPPAMSPRSIGTGLELVSKISPNGDKTPTLGRHRSFFEDIFGNIGAVGAPGAGAPTR